MIIDLVVLAVLLISAAISFFRGFIREVLTIAGLLAGLFCAYTFGDDLAPIFQNWLGVTEDNNQKLFDIVPMSLVGTALAYGTIFIAVVIIVSALSYFIYRAVKAIGLGPVDRTFGVLFGLIRGALLVSLVYLPFHFGMDENSKDSFFEDSVTHTYMEDLTEYLVSFLPSSDEVENTIDDTKQKVREKTGRAAQESLREQLRNNEFLNDGEDKKSAPDSQDSLSEEMGYDSNIRDQFETLVDETNEEPLSDNNPEQSPVY